MQLDFEMENFTSLSVTRRINWNIDYKGQNPPPDSEKVVTELTVVQRDIQAIIPLAMVRGLSFITYFELFKIHEYILNKMKLLELSDRLSSLVFVSKPGLNGILCFCFSR